jgi:hypothetical protein
MISRTVRLLVVLGLVVGIAGCKPPETPTPAPTPQSLVVPVAAAQSQPTSVPPTEVPPTVGPTATPVVVQVQVVVTATPEPEGPKGPELLAPPDGLAATLFDLMWEWEPGLGPDEWYELQIWPDTPDAEPSVFTWLRETTRRITAAHLLPGKYRWRVVVVEGYDETRGDETSPYSEERTFIMVRPSTLASLEIELPIVPTRTPTPRTYYIVVTATPTGQATIPAPTPTATGQATVPAPTATATTQATVPVATSTPTTAPATSTPTTAATVPAPTVPPPTAYP